MSAQPMKSNSENRLLFWSTVLMATLVLLLFFWGLGSLSFLSLNEARRAISAREMHASGQWLLPYMNGDLYLSKPPLFYWLELISSQLLGSVSEWSVRLPSAVFATVCCLAVYRFGVKLAGRQVGMYAVIFLAANAGFSLFARRAEIEMALTGMVFVAVYAAWQFLFQQGSRAWALLSYALLGFGLLTKGPVTLLWVIVPILVYALLTRDSRAKAYLSYIPGWLLMLAIGSSWYLAVSLKEGWGIWSAVLQEDIVKKINGSGAETWYAYLQYLAGDFFPFWLILLVRPRQLWQDIRSNRELMFLTCCCLVPLVLFSFFSEKHAKYLLPTYPAIVLLLAWQWAKVLAAIQGKWRHVLVWLPWILLCGFVLFYSCFEARVFAHRIKAFPEVDKAVASYPGQPFYTIGSPDIRLVYYAGRHVTPLTIEQVQQRSASPGLLFVTEPLPVALEGLKSCTLARFDPYLKRKRAALLIGLGSTCQAEHLSVP
ncbi:ArnT family glycosyltransferase [Pseudomonas akapageensis]|uniref:ArnT family glycosyltransferase n=1 Tax=Pseudomonas akapageensis TaxID=2609961 RepID=UPI001FE7B2BF|nr:glycosyltransferase family 39 protein [Pseudomonas akapageensis]